MASEDVEDLEDEAIAKRAVPSAGPELPRAKPAERMAARNEGRALVPHHTNAALHLSSPSVLRLVLLLHRRLLTLILIVIAPEPSRLLQKRHQRNRHRLPCPLLGRGFLNGRRILGFDAVDPRGSDGEVSHQRWRSPRRRCTIVAVSGATGTGLDLEVILGATPPGAAGSLLLNDVEERPRTTATAVLIRLKGSGEGVGIPAIAAIFVVADLE
ncbi:hypothetical protein J5N97_007251 [Dioscorea zingiberensis]|uniref:Uncharacterized protein n=1 Tax=Dioscorea zingiberensis TaxID=325984 RepID=A0A9D5DBY3_9LILI|nr:hypothetical protein J5N97_007251 [Dioscorea zingiberensis]